MLYKILLVDDEHIEVETLRNLISKKCDRLDVIEVAHDGNEAVKKAAYFKPDIILTDIKMPGLNGIEAAKIIKSFLPNCKIILLSAFDIFSFAKEAISIGVDEFIVKPAEDNAVIGAIDKVIDSLEENKSYINTHLETKSKLADVMNILEHEIIYSIICRNVNQSQVDHFFSLVGFGEQCLFAIVLEIDFDKENTDLNDELYFNGVMKNCIDRIKAEFKQENSEVIATYVRDTVYILLMYKKASKSEAICGMESEKLKTHLYNKLRNKINYQFAVGATAIAEKSKLYDSFYQAKKACQNKSKADQTECCFKDTLKKLVEYPIEAEENLFESIISGNSTEAFRLLDIIVNWFYDNLDTLELFRIKSYEFLVVLYRFVEKEYALFSNQEKNIFDILKDYKYRHEIVNYIKYVIYDIINNIENKNTQNTRALVNKACNYIDKNYRNTISLDEVADLVGWSSYYFSRVFKKHKNMSLTDYITEIRIEKSKELLKDPTIHIKDIGFFVGYEDSNYFSRVFKNKVSLSPTEYRRKAINN